MAIVGHTGADKTTIVNLLMRFYENDGGKIRMKSVRRSVLPIMYRLCQKNIIPGSVNARVFLRDSGSHGELLARKGIYAELYNSQFEEGA